MGNYMIRCFKPCYKWIIFNIYVIGMCGDDVVRCSFKPCYKWIIFNIVSVSSGRIDSFGCFKPCYKWIIFNIYKED